MIEDFEATENRDARTLHENAGQVQEGRTECQAGQAEGSAHLQREPEARHEARHTKGTPMTLSIVWRPSKDADTKLDVPAPSSFMDLMTAVGYQIPCTLDSDDRPILNGMAVVFNRQAGDDAPNPFKQLVDLLDLYDSIDLNTAT